MKFLLFLFMTIPSYGESYYFGGGGPSGSSVTGTAPIISSGGSTPAISLSNTLSNSSYTFTRGVDISTLAVNTNVIPIGYVFISSGNALVRSTTTTGTDEFFALQKNNGTEYFSQQQNGTAWFHNGQVIFGNGTQFTRNSDAYMLATSANGSNAGFTASRGDNTSYSSFDLCDNTAGSSCSTGWSMQMQPSDVNFYIMDRAANAPLFAAVPISGDVTVGDYLGSYNSDALQILNSQNQMNLNAEYVVYSGNLYSSNSSLGSGMGAWLDSYLNINLGSAFESGNAWYIMGPSGTNVSLSVWPSKGFTTGSNDPFGPGLLIIDPDDQSVVTYNNILDDGQGNAAHLGSLTVGSGTVGSGTQVYTCVGGSAADSGALLYGNSGVAQTACTVGGGTLQAENLYLNP